MHYFKRNIGDYHKKAGRLSMLEHGSYTLLMDACYDRERFPTEEEALDWCWARTEEEVAAVRFVLSKFFVLVDGIYTQERIAEEIASFHGKSEKNKQIAIEREANRKAKRARTEHETCTTGHLTTNQEPITNNQEPEEHPQTPKGAEPVETVKLELDAQEPTDDLFNRFWDKYPRKTDKTKAKAKWAKLKVNPALFDQIMRGLAAHCASADWLKDSGQFIPHPTTWLNGRRWEDELRPANVHQLRSRHHGFEDRDYTQGLTDRGDGTYDF